MRPIEFYTTPEGEVTIREMGMPERQLKESDTEFIQRFLEVLEEFYPEAYKALRETYARYDGNRLWRDFLAVRRFIKCNFGLYDNEIDIDENWNFKFEFVGCPMRGECVGFKVICQPQFNSKLSDRQLEIMRLCYEGLSDEEVGKGCSSLPTQSTIIVVIAFGNWGFTPWQSLIGTQPRKVYLRRLFNATLIYLTQLIMTKKERELTGGEVAVAILILLFSLVVLGNATEVCRIVIALVMMIGDLVLVYQAKYPTKKEVDMTDQQYLIKNLLIGAAELGAATQRKYDHPRLDLITQREAYKFFEERDTAYGEEFTHGEAWVKKW